MNGVGFIGAIIIGIAAGWLAERFMKRNDSIWINLVVGIVGSVLGSFVVGLVGIRAGGLIGSLVVSTLGAVLLLYLLGLVKKKA
jgi:uncharacterized membrane protein YeaQ/YmgE (transglycosylase-associated protein family)